VKPVTEILAEDNVVFTHWRQGGNVACMRGDEILLAIHLDDSSSSAIESPKCGYSLRISREIKSSRQKVNIPV
jgi:hypothetical protein